MEPDERALLLWLEKRELARIKRNWIVSILAIMGIGIYGCVWIAKHWGF